MNEPVYMLTTTDNPYNPFTHYDEWYTWDITHGWHINPDGSIGLGYYTAAYLARIGRTAEYGLSPAQYIRECNNAIDEIIALNLTGNYIKVAEQDYENAIAK